MIIVKAKLSDIPIIRSMCRKYAFELHRDWKALVSSKDSEVFLLKEGKRLIGITGLIYHDWNNTLQIIDVFLDPAYRKQGLGLKLINFLLNKAKRTKYRCMIAEAPAKGHIDAFYRKAGFRKCGYNDRYYSNTDSRNIAIWMSLDLK